MMKMFSIAGWSGCGKTTLISVLIKEFQTKNKKAIGVKSARHKYYLEPESTDTFKFLESGSEEVCLVARNELLFMKRITEQTDIISLLKERYASYDFLFLEGLVGEDIPLIEVFDTGKHEALKFPVEQLSAVISDKPVTGAVPNFSRGDIEKIIHFMEVYDGRR
jgi:molybdopterin-guanine dinucleotide biosynthesis adapter protein